MGTGEWKCNREIPLKLERQTKQNIQPMLHFDLYISQIIKEKIYHIAFTHQNSLFKMLSITVSCQRHGR